LARQLRRVGKTAIALRGNGVSGLDPSRCDRRQRFHERSANTRALDDHRPESIGFFSIARATVANAPTIFVMDLTRVVNPARTPVSFFVYLTGWDRCDTQKYLVGNFALFPPDHGGKFLLNPSDALRRFQAECSSSTDARLIVEMRRLNSSQPWGQVEVVVAPPSWKLDPK
jgi:hypothetical protein